MCLKLLCAELFIVLCEWIYLLIGDFLMQEVAGKFQDVHGVWANVCVWAYVHVCVCVCVCVCVHAACVCVCVFACAI